MAIVSSTSNLSPAASAFAQMRVQQARQAADQAEQVAKSLRSQAQDAQATADRAQERARAIGVQSDQAQTNADRARQGVAALQSASQTRTQLSGLLEKAAQPAVKPQQPQPVANAQGQVTGKVVNVTA